MMCRSYCYPTCGAVGWVLNLNCFECLTTLTLCVCQGGEGRTKRTRRQQIHGGTAVGCAPSAQPGSGLGKGNQTSSQDSANAGCPARGASLPLSQTPGLGGALGLEGGQPDVAGPGLCAGSSRRDCPGASKRRKGGSSPHLLCASLAPRCVAATPGASSWHAWLGRGLRLSFRPGLTGQRGLDLPVRSLIHTFTHSCTHQFIQLWPELVSKTDHNPKDLHGSRLCGQLAGLAYWLLHSLAV